MRDLSKVLDKPEISYLYNHIWRIENKVAMKSVEVKNHYHIQHFYLADMIEILEHLEPRNKERRDSILKKLKALDERFFDETFKASEVPECFYDKEIVCLKKFLWIYMRW